MTTHDTDAAPMVHVVYLTAPDWMPESDTLRVFTDGADADTYELALKAGLAKGHGLTLDTLDDLDSDDPCVVHDLADFVTKEPTT